MKENLKMKNKDWKRYLLLYTVVFAILVLFVFGYFFFQGKSFIWHMDGREQHFRALAYYGMWLRSIVKEHHFKTYTFGLGYGGDVIQTLSYYVIGDPLNLLSVFVPVKDTVYLYDALIVVRLYLAGIAFSHYCRYMGKDNPMAVLSGTLIYVFCSYSLFAAVRHPYFINPMIYFPLLVEGIERFHDDVRKPWMFIVMTALSAASNFYFFYMIVVMAVFYVLFRLPVWYGKRWKQAVKYVSGLLGIGIIGLMIAMVFFLPVVLFFLNDPRTKVKTAYGLLYEGKYYYQMFTDFIGYGRPGHWAYLGYGVLSIVSIITLFQRRKRNTDLKIAFVLLTVGMMIPAFGSFMNGMSYPVNRWIWAYSMLMGYIVVTVFDDFMILNRRQTVVTLCLLVVYVCVSLYFGDYNPQLPLMVLMFLFIMGYRFFSSEGFRKKKRTVEKVLSVFVVSSVVFNAFCAYGLDGYTKEFVSMKDATGDVFENEASEVKEISKREGQNFVRYTGRYLDENADLLEGNSSTQYYWSLGNPYIAMFNKDMALPDNRSFKYYDLDDRTMLQELASVQYMYVDTSEPVSYDYNPVSEYVYRNTETLPPGYAYHTWMNGEQYEKLDPVQKEDALLSSAYVDGKTDLKQKGSSEDVKRLSYTTAMGSKYVSRKGNTFTVMKNHAKIILHIQNPVRNAETYLSLKGMNYKGFTDMDLYTGRVRDPNGMHNIIRWNSLGIAEREKIEEKDEDYVEPDSLPLSVSFGKNGTVTTEKFFRYYTPQHQYYAGRHDFTINGGISENGFTTITITFPQMGTYTFDSIDVEALSMDTYEEKVNSLQKNVLKNIDLHENSAYSTNEITGTVSADEKELLCLTIPYAKGWDAYVDGKKTEILRTNTMYMGVALTKGKNEIRLVYHTPGWKEGLILTCAGLLACALLGYGIHQRNRMGIH